jgi:hypothetical protein
MRTPLIALCLVAATMLARADDTTVAFDGQTYRLDYQDAAKQPNGQPGDGLAEFTLPGETVKDWTKLFAFYLFPQAGDDPVAMAELMGKATKETNPDANFQVIKEPKSGDAIIDFLTWAPGSDVLEFNVFRYTRAEYGPGLVAMQYAQRFKLGDMSVEQFRALRGHAVDEMAKTEIAQARNYFAAKTKEQLGSARDATQSPSASAGVDR